MLTEVVPRPTSNLVASPHLSKPINQSMQLECTMDRRTFVAAGMAAAATHTPPAVSVTSEIKAIAFDGLALFDPRPIFALAEQFFPGKSAPLVATWRGRQFEYTWLRTIVGSYVDFLQ